MSHEVYNDDDPRLVQFCLECNRGRCVGICDAYRRRRYEIYGKNDKRIQSKIPYDALVTIDGVTKTLGEWSDMYKLSYSTLYMRIVRMGLTPEQTVALGNSKKSKIEEYHGEYMSLREWADRFDMKPATLYSRIESGWTLKKALETPVVKRRPRKEG